MTHGGAQRLCLSGLIGCWVVFVFCLFFDGLMVMKYDDDQSDCKEENSSTEFSHMTLGQGRGTDLCAVLPFRRNERSSSQREPCNGLMVKK